MSMRLIQLRRGTVRGVAIVEDPNLRLLSGVPSIYELVQGAIATRAKLSDFASQHAGDELLNYDEAYDGRGQWLILPAIDHPQEAARCLVSGTGLTHLGSARDRQSMHASLTAKEVEELTDSMKMFRWGIEGGRPAEGCIGVSPEWFYKGNGAILRAHGDSLEVPAFAEDGGEEAEVATVYVIGPDGTPWRIGMATGNEFSDHCFEKKNYLNLASSKLRNCSIGPELVIDPAFDSVPGKVTIHRAGKVLWSKQIRTGDSEMCHTLGNIEHHHFKFEAHRRPGDVHVHFLGADCLSFGEGIRLRDGDVMQIQFDGFGRPLHNRVCIGGASPELIHVGTMR
ncbi:MAG TPA: AraD1 family protein [Terriglobales bacterium]|jgi:hypothetical protein